MQTEVFALCESASNTGGGLSLLHAFDTISSAQLPVTVAYCSIALRLRFERIEEGDHKIRINVVDQDGRMIAGSVEGNFRVQPGNEQNSVCLSLAIGMQQVRFEKFGEYAVNLAVDGRSEASLPLYVRQARPGAPNPAAPPTSS
jgi:hypothetical protein